MLTVVATEPPDLGRIDGEIHDWFFDIEDVQVDEGRSELVIPFRRWSTDEARVVESASPGLRKPGLLQRWFGRAGGTEWEAPWYRWVLRVSDAVSYELIDEARIGGADFLGVTYDADRNVVRIEGNVPVTIAVVVRRLNVSVAETDEVIGLARYTTWGSGDSYTGEVLPLS